MGGRMMPLTKDSTTVLNAAAILGSAQRRSWSIERGAAYMRPTATSRTLSRSAKSVKPSHSRLARLRRSPSARSKASWPSSRRGMLVKGDRELLPIRDVSSNPLRLYKDKNPVYKQIAESLCRSGGREVADRDARCGIYATSLSNDVTAGSSCSLAGSAVACSIFAILGSFSSKFHTWD